MTSVTLKIKVMTPKQIGFLLDLWESPIPGFNLIPVILVELLCENRWVTEFHLCDLCDQVTTSKWIGFFRSLWESYIPGFKLIADKLFELSRRNGCLRTDGQRHNIKARLAYKNLVQSVKCCHSIGKIHLVRLTSEIMWQMWYCSRIYQSPTYHPRSILLYVAPISIKLAYLSILFILELACTAPINEVAHTSCPRRNCQNYRPPLWLCQYGDSWDKHGKFHTPAMLWRNHDIKSPCFCDQEG